MKKAYLVWGMAALLSLGVAKQAGGLTLEGVEALRQEARKAYPVGFVDLSLIHI